MLLQQVRVAASARCSLHNPAPSHETAATSDAQVGFALAVALMVAKPSPTAGSAYPSAPPAGGLARRGATAAGGGAPPELSLVQHTIAWSLSVATLGAVGVMAVFFVGVSC